MSRSFTKSSGTKRDLVQLHGMLADPNLDRMIDAFEAGRTGGEPARSATVWSSRNDRRILRDAWHDGRSVAWSDWLMPPAVVRPGD
jgi:hypothetical protein